MAALIRSWPIVIVLLACPGVQAQLPSEELTPPPLGDRKPIADPDLLPAQFNTAPRGSVPQNNGVILTMPGTMPTLGESRMIGAPPQPPTPVVQVMVLVPQDFPPGKDIPCTIRVTNTSGADAHKVRVRMPAPEGAAPLKSEPNGTVAANETLWDFKTLKAGESQRIELTLKPAPNTDTVNVKAFVSFEHGQAVKTKISSPKLKVKTEVPKQPNADDPIPVRVSIINEGRVALTNVKLTENISDGFVFHEDTTGEPTKDNPRLQRVWTVGTIQAGEQKQLLYRIVPKTGRDLTVTSFVAADGQADQKDSASTKVVDAALKVELRGDGKPNADQAAVYEVIVTNTGTMPLTNVRVLGSIPSECRLTRKTQGGIEMRDAVAWTIAKLPPGEREAFRWGLQSNDGGRKTVRATASGRGATMTSGVNGVGQLVSSGKLVEDSQVVETVFAGTADLHWDSRFDPPTVPLDRSGMMTIRVKNSGTDTATNVRLTLELPPDAVKFVEATPRAKQVGSQIVFESLSIPAGKTETFSVTFMGKQLGRANFAAKLAADALGDKPVGAEKYVEIVRR